MSVIGCGQWMVNFIWSGLGLVVSFPDLAFTKDKGLAHFPRYLGLPNLAGEA